MNKFLLRFDEERNDIIWGRDYDQSLTEPGPEIPPIPMLLQADGALRTALNELVGENKSSIQKIITITQAPSSDKSPIVISDPTSSTEILAYVENNEINIYTESSSIRCPDSMNELFADYTSLNDISGLLNWDTSNTTNTDSMFNNTALSDLSPLSNWNVANIQTMQYMFENSNISNLLPIAGWNTSKVEHIDSMFDNNNLAIVDIENWDLSSVISADNAFPQKTDTIACTTESESAIKASSSSYDNITFVRSLGYFLQEKGELIDTFKQQLNAATITGIVSSVSSPSSGISTVLLSDSTSKHNILGWVEDNTIYIYTDADLIVCPKYLYSYPDSMFYGMDPDTFKNLSGLSKWYTGNVVDMEKLFEGYKITDITPLSNWNVGNVANMSKLFKDTDISDLSALSNWNVGKVNSMSFMFDGCSNITDISPISNWNTGNVLDMDFMFYGTGFQILDIGGWNLASLMSCDNFIFRWHDPISEIICNEIAEYKINALINTNGFTNEGDPNDIIFKRPTEAPTIQGPSVYLVATDNGINNFTSNPRVGYNAEYSNSEFVENVYENEYGYTITDSNVNDTIPLMGYNLDYAIHMVYPEIHLYISENLLIDYDYIDISIRNSDLYAVNNAEISSPVLYINNIYYGESRTIEAYNRRNSCFRYTLHQQQSQLIIAYDTNNISTRASNGEIELVYAAVVQLVKGVSIDISSDYHIML